MPLPAPLEIGQYPRGGKHPNRVPERDGSPMSVLELVPVVDEFEGAPLGGPSPLSRDCCWVAARPVSTEPGELQIGWFAYSMQ